MARAALFLASGCGETNGLRPAKCDIPASRLYSAVALILSFAGLADRRAESPGKRRGEEKVAMKDPVDVLIIGAGASGAAVA